MVGHIPVIASILMLVVGTVVLLFGPLIVANVYISMGPTLDSICPTLPHEGCESNGSNAVRYNAEVTQNASVTRTLSNFYSAVNITGVALILIGVGALFWALRGGLGSAF